VGGGERNREKEENEGQGKKMKQKAKGPEGKKEYPEKTVSKREPRIQYEVQNKEHRKKAVGSTPTANSCQEPKMQENMVPKRPKRAHKTK